MRFTDRTVSTLKAKLKRYEVWEDSRTGFGVRVSPRGTKSWIYMYRFEGKARRMTLGTYPQMSLADANLKVAEAKKTLSKGRDPGFELVSERQTERQAETVDDLAHEYLEKYARPRKRSAHEDQRCLEKDVLPHWGKRKAKTITRREAIVLLDRIVDRGSPIMANRTLAVARRMFQFGVERDLFEHNPFIGIKPPSKEVRRDRVLNDDEIRAFWCGLDNAKMPDQVRLALKLLLLTIQRRSEVTEATWSEIDLANGIWILSGERTKNGKAHTVPLSEPARGLLGQIKALGGGSEWLFPSSRIEGRPIDRAAVNHRLAENLDIIGVSAVRPHDLRRTGASQMTAMGISRLVVSKILNHTDREITGIYDRHTYDAEKRHALDAWGQRLMEIVSGERAAANVVPLAARGKPA
jgi:integrase